MPKKAFIFCVFLSVFFSFSCDIFGNKGDDSDQEKDTETETEVDVTSAGSLPNNIKALTAPGTFTISNTGTYCADLTLYAGTWNDTESNRVINSTFTVKANVTDAKWDLTKVQGKNIWIVKSSKVYYLTNNSILILGSFENDTDYTLAFESDYESSGPYWTLSSSKNHVGFDWDTSRLGTCKSYGTSASLHEGNLVGVKANLIASPEWTFTDGDGWFTKANSASTYCYGVIKLGYTGTGARNNIYATIRARDKNNTARLFNYVLVVGKNIEVSDYVVNNAVLDSGDIIRVPFIYDLSSVGMATNEIQEVDIVVESSTPASFSVPPDIPLGTPVIESYTGYFTFKNTTGSEIKDGYSHVFLTDSGNREYLWTFANFQISENGNWKTVDKLGAGQSARLTFYLPSKPPYEETYSFIAPVLVWNRSVATPETSFVPVNPSFVTDNAERKNANGNANVNACVYFETIR